MNAQAYPPMAPKPAARKAAVKSLGVPPATVVAAARELATVTGGPDSPPDTTLTSRSTFLPILPPAASSTGRGYYVFSGATAAAAGSDAPFVAAGQQVALAFLGGSWLGRGRAPKGFADLEEALNHAIDELNRPPAIPRGSVAVHWQYVAPNDDWGLFRRVWGGRGHQHL